MTDKINAWANQFTVAPSEKNVFITADSLTENYLRIDELTKEELTASIAFCERRIKYCKHNELHVALDGYEFLKNKFTEKLKTL